MTAQLTAYAALGAVLAIAFWWYERRRPPARTVALVAAMAALAVVGRLAFAAVPGVKPTTDIVLFAGYALGGVPGFMVGAVTAVASNVIFGQGPWTLWQMVAWGAVGVGGAALARVQRGREPSRWTLAAACAVAGTSLGYNAAHVLASATFAALIGPTFIRAIQRYRRRFEVEWEPPEPAEPDLQPVR